MYNPDNLIDELPEPEVVKEDGHELAGELQLDDEVVVLGLHDEQQLGYEQAHHYEPVQKH